METRRILDARTVVAVISLVALVSVIVWSFGFGLTSVQSLQNQVDDLTAQKIDLQSEVASLNAQLAEKENYIASLNAQLTEKRAQIQDLEEQIAIYLDYIREEI